MKQNKNLIKLVAKISAIREKTASMVDTAAYKGIPGAMYPSPLSADPTTNPILNPFRNLDFGSNFVGNYTGGTADMLLPDPDAGFGQTLFQNLGDYGGAYAGGAVGGNLLNRLYNQGRMQSMGLSSGATPADLATSYPTLFSKYYGLEHGGRFGIPNTSVLRGPSPQTTLGVPNSMVPLYNLVTGYGGMRRPVMPPGAATAIPDVASSAGSAGSTPQLNAQPNVAPGGYAAGTPASEAFLQTARNMANPASAPPASSTPAPAQPARSSTPMRETVFIEPMTAKGLPSGKPFAVNPTESIGSRVNTGRPRAERIGGALGLLTLLAHRLRDSGTVAAPATTAIDIDSNTGGVVTPEDQSAFERHAGRIPRQ